MTDDEKQRRILVCTAIALMVLFFLGALMVNGKDLPLIVSIPELSESNDGQRVAIFGWARSGEVRTGRMGSAFIALEVGEGNNSVTVFSIFPVYNILNNSVIVQGKYHHSGRFGGILQSGPFIVAEEIIRDWK